MASFVAALALAAVLSTANAHTSFTTLFVDGVNQGDGTCVRQPADPQTATYPLLNLTSSDMICGRDGLAPVNYTCAVPAGATLSFEFRETPDGSAPGALDPSHKGPCAVYMKRMADMGAAVTTPSAAWFKIWARGYTNQTGQWCTETLIADNGLLSVKLPSGLPAGGYLVRPELLSLHEAALGRPQFYVGCAQIYIATGAVDTNASLVLPAAYEATIPGYVEAGDASVTFDVYAPVFPYPLAGPPVYAPNATVSIPVHAALAYLDPDLNLDVAAAHAGIQLVPPDCLVKNANWCGVEVAAYTTEAGCWNASADCFRQEGACYAAAPPSGHANCGVWDAKCMAIQAACAAGDFAGPPDEGRKLQQVEATVPGLIPTVGS